ncbi:MAG: hypothetical protein EXS14_05880 [Planctomycetes bacterium]|nr:hypothetical protein [Planctomycetota bacterium]
MELDREAVRLRRRAIERTAELAREQGLVREADQRVSSFAQQVKVLRVKLDTRQVELKSAEGAIARYEQQLLQLRSVEDLARMQTQIDGKKTELGLAEDRILESMEVMEKADAGLKELRSVAADRLQRLALRNETAAKETGEDNARLAQVALDWDAAAAAVGAELLASYSTRRDSAGDYGAAAVDGSGFCAACGTRLTPQLETASRSGKLPDCPTCQRLLLPAADSEWA